MIQEIILTLFEGFAASVAIFALTLLFSLPLGLVISFGSMSTIKPLRWLSKTVVWVVRSTPLLLQVLLVYYGPGLIFGLPLMPRLMAAVLSFVINYACYFSEIFRGGIQGVAIGQREAGQVLGMTKGQIFFKITLIQVVKRIIPPMSNEFITLVKDTALVRVIAVQELIFMGESFMKSDGIIWPLFSCAIFYLVFNGLLTLLFDWYEKKLSYFR